MNFPTTLIATVAVLAFSTTVHAAPINVTFNFVPTGNLTANTGDVTTATTITAGAPDIVTAILSNNVSLTAFQSITLLSPTPVGLGTTFSQSFSTNAGAFDVNLTVTAVATGQSSLGIAATGIITGPAGFDSTPIFYSASYTQNGGPGSQINGSFNDSTISTSPSPVGEPATVALLATGLAGLTVLRRRR